MGVSRTLQQNFRRNSPAPSNRRTDFRAGNCGFCDAFHWSPGSVVRTLDFHPNVAEGVRVDTDFGFDFDERSGNPVRKGSADLGSRNGRAQSRISLAGLVLGDIRSEAILHGLTPPPAWSIPHAANRAARLAQTNVNHA